MTSGVSLVAAVVFSAAAAAAERPGRTGLMLDGDSVLMSEGMAVPSSLAGLVAGSSGFCFKKERERSYKMELAQQVYLMTYKQQ